ncbi:MAG: hypothetical protein WBP41_12250 [Saprospiraceae bacterium]
MTETPLNNIWISIVTIFFALSLISERIANMVKLRIPWLNIDYTDDLMLKKKEKTISMIALLSGLLTSILAGADFNTLVHDGALINYAKKGLTEIHLSTIIGFFLTALFISLGSKFWHDVLDIVLEFSKLKKYRADEQRDQRVQNRINIQRESTNYLLDKVKLFEPRLKQMNGYLGYYIKETNNNENELVINFSKLFPEDNNNSELREYFKDNRVNILKIDETNITF